MNSIHTPEKHYYRIAYNGIIVDGITPHGEPIIQSNPSLKFDSFEQANSYLQSATSLMLMRNPINAYDHSENYSVVHETVKLVDIKYNSIISSINMILNENFKPSMDEYKGILICGISVGFNKIGFSNIETVLDFIKNPKYTAVVESTVPTHIIANIENFFNSGIKSCSQDDISAIILTSTDEMLNELKINNFIKNTSK